MGNVEIPNWLKELPLAPEFRPTDTEFADPIAYISKIEKEASSFGICKIIPPIPKPSKKYVFSNLNKSLLKCPELGSDISSLGFSDCLKTSSGDNGNHGMMRAVFTTRHQELGQCIKKTKGTVQNPLLGVQKQVWQSGEVYTLEQFESKAKSFARSILGMVKDVSPLVIEAMFWKAASEKPIYVEYANDVPGSAFGESKGRFQYMHHRRRKKAYYKRSLVRSDFKQTETDSVRHAQSDETEGASAQSHADTCLQTVKSDTTELTFSPNEASQSSREKSSDTSNDMEGTAGWKISNSPWNLQVIARSPGSLTRFMPDDIPGVTSPMVYIGMLFSWFAWHVEDHELHSLNFLHTGSSKTWYAVPGDYAFAFEEVIRSDASGGNIDHLAALTLLGEKTTLLSPEVMVSSKIPCCRLVQSPGEFVVTFPRAYHAGFSHGFNCGEAANFGTPQWLRIAKEAAVRRAAMNYLPMLSHQQLLYLLTMSFISSVPRTLLPGVRSSRLRDRQKEDKEFLVKKAFIEDMLHENKLLSSLLKKESTYQVVLWNADLLPDSSKDCHLPDLASTTGTSVADVSNISSADRSSHHLFDEMGSYVNNLTDLYLGGDDLPCHFETDSGALACVGCGILGFPFMTVVQPSERLIMELLPANHHLVQESYLNSNPSLHGYISGDFSVSDPSSVKELSKQSFSSKFFRPRIFCLEHTVQLVEMMQCRGGVNVLIICHSDFQKIKAQARAVAEAIDIAFDFDEVPIDFASPENLTMIDRAIDGEEHDDCEDWTSKLGINLQYCVNARKNFPSKQVPCILALGTLFSDEGPGSELLSINWQSRKSRSRRFKNHLVQNKPCGRIQIKKDNRLEGRLDGSAAKKEKKLIQYTRRKFKSKQSCFSGASMVCELKDKSIGDHYNCASKNEHENFRSDFKLSRVSASTAMSPVQHEIQVTEVPTSMSLNTGPSQLSKIDNQNMHELDIDWESSLTSSDSKMHYSTCVSGICDEENQVSHYEKFSCSLTNATDRKIEMLQQNQITEAITFNKKDNSSGLDDGVHQELQSTCKSNQEGASLSASLVNEPTLAFMNGSSKSPENNYAAERIVNAMSLNKTSDQEMDSLIEMDKDPIPSYDKSINEHSPSEKVFEVLGEHCTAAALHNTVILDNEIPQETEVGEGSKKLINQLAHGECAEGFNDGVISEYPKLCQSQTKIKINEEPVYSYVAEGENGSITISELEYPKISVEKCHKEDSGIEFISDKEKEQEIQPDVRIDEEHCPGAESSLKDAYESNRDCCIIEKQRCNTENVNGRRFHLSQNDRELESFELMTPVTRANNRKKRKREVEQLTKSDFSCYNFIRSPCEGLRPRTGKIMTGKSGGDISQIDKENVVARRSSRHSEVSIPRKKKKDDVKRSHKCDLDGCRMSFMTKAELLLHKRNRCPHEGCGKKFSSHKYALIHQRVHDVERPLKCPWKGCSMTFKWAWARTEHLRVHTGEKPYQCKFNGCGLSFRFVSDFSRHRRKTGHHVN